MPCKYVKIDVRNRVTLPNSMLNHLGVKAGDTVRVMGSPYGLALYIRKAAENDDQGRV